MYKSDDVDGNQDLQKLGNYIEKLRVCSVASTKRLYVQLCLNIEDVDH